MWMAEEEKKSVSRFVMHRGVVRTKNTSTRHYYCHRGGSFQSKSTGARRLKSQGSCKTGISCPASIVVVAKDGVYAVTYHPTHHGHENQLDHPTLPSGVTGQRRQRRPPGGPRGWCDPGGPRGVYILIFKIVRNY